MLYNVRNVKHIFIRIFMRCNMIIIKQAGHFFVVRIGRKYHTVCHDPATCRTWTVVPSDGDVRIAEGWNVDAIKAVSTGRKKNTAVTYYWQAMRRFKTKQMKTEAS